MIVKQLEVNLYIPSDKIKTVETNGNSRKSVCITVLDQIIR